jgi:hypothetical protein
MIRNIPPDPALGASHHVPADPKRGLWRQRVVINSLDHVSHHANNPDTVTVTLPQRFTNAVRIDLIDYDIPYAPLIILQYLHENQTEPPAAFKTLAVLESIYLRERTQTLTPTDILLRYTLSDGSSFETRMSVVDVITDSRDRGGTGLSYVAQLVITGEIPITHLNDAGIYITMASGIIREDGELGEGINASYVLTADGGQVSFLNYFIKPFILNVDIQQGEPWLLSTRSRAQQVASDDIFFRNDVIRIDVQDFIVTRTTLYDQDFGATFSQSIVQLTEPASRTSAINRNTFHIFRPTEVTTLTRLRPDCDAIMPVSFSFLPTDITTITIGFRQLSGGEFYFPFSVRASTARTVGRGNIAKRVYMDWSLTFDIWYYNEDYVSNLSGIEKVPVPV